ncbi:hypothetical protein [Parageobacillus toebii]|uniref:hypothetical protein n=1 Tax=Parageobacillus toebii TaxID=153151 RepID=UPI002815F1EE|nr:hypothetical protein [Parageobacillus toebii]WMT18521.1 hypothetical protein RFB12_14800 [Parageobacillus toebii]
MKLDGIWMESIELDKIVPIYVENVSKRAVEKMVKILERGYQLSSHIIVEKDRTEDKYWLVAGFLEYSVYKKMNEKHKRYTRIFCVIQRYSNETEQRIKLLRRMFHHQTTKWLDKHLLIDQMVNDGVKVATIARKLGVTQADIENYFVHPDIPFDIIKQACENEGSLINIEKIRKLPIHSLLKYKLYQRAVLPKRHPDRLTTDKLQKIKWLLKRDYFNDLGREDQWEMLQQALDYRGTLENTWDLDIERRLKRMSQGELILKFTFNPDSYNNDLNSKDLMH